MSHFGIPGVGGSLGCCALCGEPFVAEILFGRSVKSFTQAGSSTMFYGHDKCLEDAKSCKTLLDLPAASPLRQAYERQEREKSSSPTEVHADE